MLVSGRVPGEIFHGENDRSLPHVKLQAKFVPNSGSAHPRDPRIQPILIYPHMIPARITPYIPKNLFTSPFIALNTNMSPNRIDRSRPKPCGLGFKIIGLGFRV